MNNIIACALLISFAGLCCAQQANSDLPPAEAAGQMNAQKFAAFKKKITDSIDERIGKLEELEECIQAAKDMKAVKDCRSAHVKAGGSDVLGGK